MSSRDPGYLVAATALKSPGRPRADRCPSGSYIDFEAVPFFVLPNCGFGDVQVGDIMVARVNDHGIPRIVYGLVGHFLALEAASAKAP